MRNGVGNEHKEERNGIEKHRESSEEDEPVRSRFGSDLTHNPLPIHLVSTQRTPQPKSTAHEIATPIPTAHETKWP